MLEWEEVGEEEFARAGADAAPAWAALLDALAAGKAVRVPVADRRDRRSKRVRLGQRARRRGFRVEVRYGEGFFVARRRAEDPEEPPPG